MRVQKLVRIYPDYGKVLPEYIAAMTEVFEAFPEEVQERLLSPLHGLPSQSRFLPVPFDAKELGGKIAASLFVPKPKADEPEKIISLDERRRVGEKMLALAKELKHSNAFPNY
jgi:hypothetical protein